MHTPEPSLEALANRLGALENQYHSFKSEVLTEKLVLLDAAGKTRATLRMSSGVPSLILYDTNGEVRAILRVDDEGPALHLLDSKTKAGLELKVGESGPDVSLFDANGKQRLDLAGTGFQSGTPYLSLLNADGMQTVTVTSLEEGPSINLSIRRTLTETL